MDTNSPPASFGNPSSSPAADAHSADTPEKSDVARLAHEMWREQGYPEGCDEKIWLEAERRLAAGREDTTATPQKENPLIEEEGKGLRNLDLVGLPSDSRGQGPTSLH